MTEPKRIQLRRTRGYRLQEVSEALNGLPAVKVDRTTKWGNPHKVGDGQHECRTAEAAVKKFEIGIRDVVERGFTDSPVGRIVRDIDQLRGKNLACWCKLGDPCHADVLLKLANGEADE